MSRHRLPEYLRGHSQSWGTKVRNHSLCHTALECCFWGERTKEAQEALPDFTEANDTPIGLKKFAPGHFQVRQEEEKWVLKHKKLEETLPGFLFCFLIFIFYSCCFCFASVSDKARTKVRLSLLLPWLKFLLSPQHMFATIHKRTQNWKHF